MVTRSEPIQDVSTVCDLVAPCCAGGGDGFAPSARSASSSGGFQEVEGESEDRRRMRFERYQKVQERAVSELFHTQPQWGSRLDAAEWLAQ